MKASPGTQLRDVSASPFTVMEGLGLTLSLHPQDLWLSKREPGLLGETPSILPPARSLLIFSVSVDILSQRCKAAFGKKKAHKPTGGRSYFSRVLFSQWCGSHFSSAECTFRFLGFMAAVCYFFSKCLSFLFLIPPFVLNKYFLFTISPFLVISSGSSDHNVKLNLITVCFGLILM